ncbi:MAG: tetratricopeptide repeat protein [Bacteroidales bacterium]|nr:tetratricopeptide repeat protein [Bacteroidales bacterium]
MFGFFAKNKDNVWCWAFVALAVIMLFAMILMSKTAGNSGDEDGFQIPQAKNVINYYKTDGQDTTCLNFKDVMQYYGSSFDVVAEFFNSTFHIEDISKSRHIFNSILGWLAILAVGLIAYQLGGARAGVFALLLMFLSPRFLGHSFNNPKDIPFAAGVICAILGMILFFKQFPKVKWYTYLILLLSIAFSISVRIGGLILFGYFGLLGLMFLIRLFAQRRQASKMNSKSKQATQPSLAKYILKLVLSAVAVCVVAYFAGLLLWPYAMQAPIKNPIEAFKAMSAFSTSIRQLFEGTIQWSDMLPWYYTPKYIFITIPIAVILGLVLFFIYCWRKKEDRFWAFFVFFTFFFPVFWIIYTHANVYGGWRHAMFAYPPMVAAAGWGFDALVRKIEEKLAARAVGKDQSTEPKAQAKPLIVNVASVVVLLLLLVGPIRHIIANHPYEYVYFNELSGGVKKAFGNYELDYYYHSTREATEWVMANAEPKPDGSQTIVGTWHTASVSYFLRNDTARFKPAFLRWYERDNSDWDYAVFTITGINPEYLRSKAFPPKNTVKTIEVDGVPIAIVLKRQEKFSHEAFKLKNANNLDSAATLYHQALAVDPDNYVSLLGLSEVMVRFNRPDSAQYYLNKAFAFEPNSEGLKLMYAYSLLGQQKEDEALSTLRQISKYNPKYSQAYQLAIRIYLQRNDLVSAKKEFLKIMDVDRMDDATTQLWLLYESKTGVTNEQQAYRNLYNEMIKSLERRGKQSDAEKLRQQLK